MNAFHSTQPNDAACRAHERNIVNARLLTIFGAGLLLLVAMVLLLIYSTIRLLATQIPSESMQLPQVHSTDAASAPQVTLEQPQLLRELRESEHERLSTYEWVDEQAGIARIPIDRAMDILARRGFPNNERESEEFDGDSLE